MHGIFESNETEAILLVEVINAFNSINQKALLHNIEFLSPIIATFLYNCYVISAQLFIIGKKESKSREETTQGDPTAMTAYVLVLTPLLDHLRSIQKSIKTCRSAGAGKLEEIKSGGRL